jgi:hypothetical protein
VVLATACAQYRLSLVDHLVVISTGRYDSSSILHE